MNAINQNSTCIFNENEMFLNLFFELMQISQKQVAHILGVTEETMVRRRKTPDSLWRYERIVLEHELLKKGIMIVPIDIELTPEECNLLNRVRGLGALDFNVFIKDAVKELVSK